MARPKLVPARKYDIITRLRITFWCNLLSMIDVNLASYSRSLEAYQGSTPPDENIELRNYYYDVSTNLNKAISRVLDYTLEMFAEPGPEQAWKEYSMSDDELPKDKDSDSDHSIKAYTNLR